MMSVTLLDSNLRVPAIGLDLSEKRAVFHHSSAARSVVFQRDEAPISVPGLQIGPGFWKDVGMYVVGAHAYADYCGRAITLPHEEQVRASRESLNRLITGGS